MSWWLVANIFLTLWFGAWPPAHLASGYCRHHEGKLRLKVCLCSDNELFVPLSLPKAIMQHFAFSSRRRRQTAYLDPMHSLETHSTKGSFNERQK